MTIRWHQWRLFRDPEDYAFIRRLRRRGLTKEADYLEQFNRDWVKENTNAWSSDVSNVGGAIPLQTEDADLSIDEGFILEPQRVRNTWQSLISNVCDGAYAKEPRCRWWHKYTERDYIPAGTSFEDALLEALDSQHSSPKPTTQSNDIQCLSDIVSLPANTCYFIGQPKDTGRKSFKLYQNTHVPCSSGRKIKKLFRISEFEDINVQYLAGQLNYDEALTQLKQIVEVLYSRREHGPNQLIHQPKKIEGN